MNLNSFLLFSHNPKKLADFYTKVFKKEPEWYGGVFCGWKVGDSSFAIGPHSKVKGENKTPERMMFNFETEDFQKEYERLKKIVPKIIAEPYQPSEEEDMWIATFADPDGNYFQLTTPFSA